MAEPRLLIVAADDLGLNPSYDRGILEAAHAGALDAVGVMVRRLPRAVDLAALGELGIALGLHLEPEGGEEAPGRETILRQLEAFELLAGRPPDHLDGHHHCHASPAIAGEVAAIAAGLDLPVRSISAEHRRDLREAGVLTPDLLVGRLHEDEPLIPAELSMPPAGVASIEWMVHPGHPDPGAESSYDRGRGEDLRTLLALEPAEGMVRGDHRSLRG